jgi:predicted aldo/keto reductase-like oxidoreductase
MNSASVKRTPVDWALQFLWNRPEVATVLSGMSNLQMVVENCDSAAGSGINSLDQEEESVINRLAEIYQEKILVPCTGCEYCMPCPSGVNIPQNFAILNNFSLEQGRLHRFRLRRGYKKLVGSQELLDLENPNGNGSICINCGECLEKCPQEINIPIELERVHAILGKGKKIDKFYS